LVVNRYDHLSYYRHPDHYQHLDHFQYIPAVIGHRVPGKNHVIYACYENTLAFFLEGLEDFSVWNRNRHGCQINFQDHFDFEAKGFWLTSTQLTKNKLAAVFSFFEVETDILVLLWKLDTLEPSEDNINFLTRLKISPWSRWTLSYKLHLNDIFVCIDDDDDPERKMMVINLVDHNDDTKHKMIQFETGELGNNDISIEEGESNRIALFKKTEMVFQLFNLESGTYMINLDLMYILPDFVRGPLNCFNFCMGNMVFICPVKKAGHEIESFQYIILTQDGEVVIGDNVEVEWKIADTETSVTHMDLVSFVVVTKEQSVYEGFVDRKIYFATRNLENIDESVESNLVVINPAV